MASSPKFSSSVAVGIGMLGVILGGFHLGLLICDPLQTGPVEGPPHWMCALFIPLVLLFWYGLWSEGKALYAIVIIPVPVILASALYLLAIQHPYARWVLFGSVLVPVTSNVVVSAYYRAVIANKGTRS